MKKIFVIAATAFVFTYAGSAQTYSYRATIAGDTTHRDTTMYHKSKTYKPKPMKKRMDSTSRDTTTYRKG